MSPSLRKEGSRYSCLGAKRCERGDTRAGTRTLRTRTTNVEPPGAALNQQRHPRSIPRPQPSTDLEGKDSIPGGKPAGLTAISCPRFEG